MVKTYSIVVGKAVRRFALLRGGGSALPGLVVEKIDPEFISRTLAQLPEGVVLITGSNGKTTTTKIAVELLQSQGLRVFTNRSGSNFSRGVAAALLQEVDLQGRLAADIAVLELDEAHGVLFTKTVQPDYILLLNVMRDQLDRFGEVDTIAKLLKKIASTAKKGVVYNRDDPRLQSLAKIMERKEVSVATFGASPQLQSLFLSDDNLHSKVPQGISSSVAVNGDDTCLAAIEDRGAIILFQNKKMNVGLKISGAYNILNAVSAIALCRMIMKEKLQESELLLRLGEITPAFGRGEIFSINGSTVEIVLVKNPAGFRLSLVSFPPTDHCTMIAINDNFADGRDMSWLWDVDFTSLQKNGVSMVSGTRAYDMALRLQYDEVPVSEVNTNLKASLNTFLSKHPQKPKRIFCTYTAMLEIRRVLGRKTKVERMT